MKKRIYFFIIERLITSMHLVVRCGSRHTVAAHVRICESCLVRYAQQAVLPTVLALCETEMLREKAQLFCPRWRFALGSTPLGDKDQHKH
jgi:hypothetical protein